MDKKQLRIYYKKLRSLLTSQEQEQKSLAIANKLLELDIWNKSYYHLFLPIKTQREINTEYVLSILMGKDKNIVLSKTNFNSMDMEHFLLTDNTIISENAYGIPEPKGGQHINPKQLDVIFVPLLAFDLKGNRVGYGKGFYDRFLSLCSSEALRIGLSFFEPETQIDDLSETDLPLDYCITPTTIYDFRS